MPTTDLHLVVDIAAWWTTAVYESGGVVRPVLFDGRARLPSGVFHDCGVYTAGTTALAEGIERPEGYRPDPMTLLQHGGPVAAVTAALGFVAERVRRTAPAGVITELTVVTAQLWEEPARQRLEQAAAGAGLPRPRAVTIAAAAAALTDVPLAMVCVAGTAWPELTLVDTRDGYRHLAAAPVRTPGVPAVDEALLRVAAGRGGTEADPDDWRFTREAERARAVLAVQPRAAMLLPEPQQAVVLTRDDLAAAVAAHLDRLADTGKQLLIDAGTDPGAVAAVILVGADPQLAAALSEAGLPPALTVCDPHELLRSAAGPRPPGRSRWQPWRRRRR